jgi:hypothetical protein
MKTYAVRDSATAGAGFVDDTLIFTASCPFAQVTFDSIEVTVLTCTLGTQVTTNDFSRISKVEIFGPDGASHKMADTLYLGWSPNIASDDSLTWKRWTQDLDTANSTVKPPSTNAIPATYTLGEEVQVMCLMRVLTADRWVKIGRVQLYGWAKRKGAWENYYSGH